MDGTIIDYVKYRDGHSRLGNQAISGQLIAIPSNLTFRSSDGIGLFSVPWENLENAYQGVLRKTGLANAGSLLLGAIPVLDLFASSYYVGFWLVYWDNEIQREQQVFFDVGFGSERRGDQAVRKIFQCRDHYFRQKRNMSSPQQR
jgi:hypothetical protein